ncbi:kinase-like protein [Microthyrium microscopicum]|uniref:Kinase-like protein n=1 Tax=Microthyrium microscopicum TaxID=703497 RepID=A0A6A6UM99_9PEZI|nr:kinase-like protein [Microthyrium microscopicum]
MSSRTITSVVTSDTIALNAAVFGYAGHSLVTPHSAIKQIWWTEERIQAKVTRDFIVSKLRPDERAQLDQPVSFGSELTDATYIDWILDKTKRLFLILVEVGVPDQIFGAIDDVWDDHDLPIPLEDVDKLALSWKNDETLNRKFYSTQYSFLLRPLTEDAHIKYGPNEVIPLEYVHRLPPAAILQSWLKMHLPKEPNEIYVRRKVNLGATGDKVDPTKEAQFLADIQKARLIQHKHIAFVWASYTSKGNGFFLTTFEAEHTLKSFIDFRSAASLQKLTKTQRNETLLTWLHCLADALASIHDQGMYHCAITPSNILIDGENQIAFSDIGSLKTFQTEKKHDPSEGYNYGAPENHATKPLPFLNSSPESSFSRFTHRRKKSTDSKRSSTTKSRQSSHSSGNSVSSLPDIVPPLVECQTPSVYFGQQADVFSLACIFTDIITYMIKKKLSDFVKYRTTKRKDSITSSPSKGNADSSFHNNLGKITDWTEVLEAEAAVQDDPTCRAIPLLMRLVRWMMSPNPLHRPSAAEVRERVFDILIGHAGVESVCCHSAHRAMPGNSAPTVPRLTLPPKPMKGGDEVKSRAGPSGSSEQRKQTQRKPVPLYIPKDSETSVNNVPPSPSKTSSSFSGFVRGLKWRKQNT